MRVSQWTVQMGTFRQSEAGLECRYCGAVMTWIPLRWFGRGTFAWYRCWNCCVQESMQYTAAIPVSMLTGQEEPDLMAQAAKNGAATLLMKPCPVEKLTSVITSAISASSARA